jgi:ribosomal protein S18 acetylase RimI-like enzyme
MSAIEIIELDEERFDFKELRRFLYRLCPQKLGVTRANSIKKVLKKNPFQREQKIFLARGSQGLCGTLTAKMTKDPLIGVIGFYECLNDEKISRQLFDYAIDFFLQRNVKKIIGPMSRSTLDGYRYCLQKNDGQTFLHEPLHQAYYPTLWEQYGFVPYLDYSSILIHKSPPLTEKWKDAYLNALEQGFYLKKMKQASDLDVFKRLIKDSQAEYQHQEVLFSWWTEDARAMRSNLNKIIKQGVSYFIYNNNGKVVGAILARVEGGQLNVYDARVLRSYQKQGLGGALFYQLAKVAKTKRIGACLLCMIREDLNPLSQTKLLKGELLRNYRLYQFNLP